MKCKHFCKDRVAKTLKKNKSDKKLASKSKFKEIYKKSLKKCKTDEERQKVEEEYKKKMESIKIMDEVFKKLNNKKILMDTCNAQYCNEGCKGTLYEDEPGTVLKEKMNPKEYDSLLGTRKRMFNGKKSILEDSFYEKLSASRVKKLKKQGAVSGCVNDLGASINCCIQ